MKVSTQATESSVAVGPAVVKVSKSSLKVQTSESDQKYCYLLYSKLEDIQYLPLEHLATVQEIELRSVYPDGKPGFWIYVQFSDMVPPL